MSNEEEQENQMEEAIRYLMDNDVVILESVPLVMCMMRMAQLGILISMKETEESVRQSDILMECMNSLFSVVLRSKTEMEELFNGKAE